MADAADTAKAVFGGIHGVSASILKAQASVFDKALPGASGVVSAATEALGGLWKSAGLLPDEPGASRPAPPPAAAPAPGSKEPATAPAAAPAGSGATPSTATAPVGAGGLLGDPRVGEVVSKGADKVAWYLAKRGILNPPPPPPEEALRKSPPVVDGRRADAASAQRAVASDGTRLTKKDGP